MPLLSFLHRQHKCSGPDSYSHQLIRLIQATTEEKGDKCESTVQRYTCIKSSILYSLQSCG